MKRITLETVMPLIKTHVENGGGLQQSNFDSNVGNMMCSCPITILNGGIIDDDIGPINQAAQKGYTPTYLWGFVFGFDCCGDNVDYGEEQYEYKQGLEDGRAVFQECKRLGYPLFNQTGCCIK